MLADLLLDWRIQLAIGGIALLAVVGGGSVWLGLRWLRSVIRAIETEQSGRRWHCD